MTDLPQVRDVEGGGAVHSLSPCPVARIPHQPGVEFKARCLEPTLGCCDHLREEDGWRNMQYISDCGRSWKQVWSYF